MRSTVVVSVLLCVAATAAAQTTDAPPLPPVIGRWDITIQASPRAAFPSWVEVQKSGFTTLVGRFVGRIGSARPIGRIEWTEADSTFSFSIPPEWSRDPRELRVEGRLTGDSLVGTIGPPNALNIGSQAATLPFVARRAPILRRAMPTAWTTPRPLFNGKDLTGWTPTAFGRNNWAVRDGTLVTTAAEGANLFTTEKFQDFKLHIELRLPKGGDTGIFLRGRYEVQARPDTATNGWPSALTTGAIYSFLTPNENAALGPGRWQTMDITLVGRRVTVVVNGKTVIADQIIPGVSGSALDADESAPGPIMLQGEELTTVEFRNITISVPRSGSPAPPATPPSPALGCAESDSVSAVGAVRARLAEWVRQTNAGDREGANEVWAPSMVGWFPRASIFSDSAAYAAAGTTRSATGPVRTKFEIVVDDIVASGPVVVVHDVWTETRELGTSENAAQRVIRGSELWRCQPDGRWRIARYVSAPEPWKAAR
jgi:ketosteroid isomerase-like protein